MRKPYHWVVAWGWVLASMAAGCQKDDEIVRYSVRRKSTEKLTQTASARSDEVPRGHAEQTGGRMLASIIPQKETAWFFKLIGSEKSVAAQTARFRSFIESVHFSEQGSSPDWKLPDGWSRKPGSGMRYATIGISTSNEPLELTVTPLKTGAGDFADYVLANVDRWRQQLGLPPTSKSELFQPNGRTSELIEVSRGDGEKALIVDLVGKPGSSPASQLAGSTPPPPERLSAAHTGSDRPDAKPRLTYQTPPGWTSGKVDGLRQVAFDVIEAAERAEVTVISLAASAGDLLANVNRWREQVHLSPVGRDELERQSRDFTVEDVTGHWVDLVAEANTSPREAILGVICLRGEKAWFFKMKGNANLVMRQRGRFETFVRSVKFDVNDGAHDGH